MIKPGWQTSEFWTTLIGQSLSLLTIMGVVHVSDAATLQDAASKCVAAIFVIAANALVVISYIRSRTMLKQPGTAATPPPMRVIPFVLLGLLLPAALGGSTAFAQHVSARVPACFFRRSSSGRRGSRRLGSALYGRIMPQPTSERSD